MNVYIMFQKNAQGRQVSCPTPPVIGDDVLSMVDISGRTVEFKRSAIRYFETSGEASAQVIQKVVVQATVYYSDGHGPDSMGLAQVPDLDVPWIIFVPPTSTIPGIEAPIRYQNGDLVSGYDLVPVTA